MKARRNQKKLVQKKQQFINLIRSFFFHSDFIEALTDPSYRGQILVLTYPLIGNYGVPDMKVSILLSFAVRAPTFYWRCEKCFFETDLLILYYNLFFQLYNLCIGIR